MAHSDKIMIQKKLVHNRPAVIFTDTKHTPYNKRPGEVDSRADLGFQYYDGQGSSNTEEWLEIKIDETTTTDKKTSTRTISMVLKKDEIFALLELIVGGDHS
tara:strand:- start:5905 stop:6210 length:306 start_codon:yes stop_codon:yes gene_type:complete